MLDPEEKSAFEGMVHQLRADDPKFADKFDRVARPRRRTRKVVAILLWMIAPVCIAVGGWTGFFMAIAAAAYGAHLVTKRTGLAGGSGFSWWSSPGKRPGASL